MRSFKRSILAGFFLCATGFIGIIHAQSLRDLAEPAGLLIGAYDSGLDWDDRLFPIWLGPPEYATTLAGEFNAMVINVSMPSVQNQQGVFDFEYPDSAIAFAKANNMKIIGQHLVWGAGHPTGFWFDDPAQVPCNPDTVKAILKNHVETVAKQFKGKIYAYSVVNEELVFGTTNWDNSSWRNCIGGHFIDSVFVWVSQVDSSAKLYYNETEAEAMGNNLIGQRSDSVFAMVSRLAENGIPIDGVGMQMHTSLGSVPNAGPRDLIGLQNNISRYASLGLDVYLTEIDVSISHRTGSLGDKLREQGKVYSDILRICLSNKNCRLFNVWGVADQYSWIFYEFPLANIPAYPEESPLLFDTLFVQKPAYDSLVSIFKNNVVSVSEDGFSVFSTEFVLEQNYPNPFNPETTIKYRLAHDSHVTLRVFNLRGQEVETLVDKSMSPGEHQAVWNGRDRRGLAAASGIYLVQFSANNSVRTRKMLLIR